VEIDFTEKAMAAASKRDFRLAKDVRPTHYGLRFDLDLDHWTSKGRERIDLHLDRPTRTITLHSVELEITSARIEGGPSFEGVDYDEESETATPRFADEVLAGDHALGIEWTGAIREALRGLYRSTHGGERYAATQFEATDARRAFPCFDEPEFKARFTLELVHDPRLTAIANAPIERTESLSDGRQLTRFAPMPRISTYLVAFTAGPYASTDETRTRTGLPVRVWLPPGLVDKGTYARDSHVRSVQWLENYTGIPYPYQKLDAIGIPDFEAGAMENPGAITYRTQLLAADAVTASTASFKRIYSVVSHELTHMWWGDLVTMAWWNDLWLNESFASFVGEKATDALNPDWGYLRDMAADATPAYNLDQLVSTHPISMEVRNAVEAAQRFDAVTYLKGQAVLRMIESFIGEDAFREGVRIYLRRHAEANATADDFWRALDEATGRDVSAIANAWIREPGHPLVTCTVHETADGLEVDLRQQRFFADPAASPTGQRWLVPIVIKYGTERGVHEERILMEGERASVKLPGARWYHPNAGARGFYRYALDDRSLQLLAGAVRQLDAGERLMLIDNQWALTRAGKADLRQLFALLEGLRGEEDRAVLDAIAGPIAWLATHAVDDALRPAFQGFVQAFFSPAFGKLGWDPIPGESSDDREKRSTLIAMLGRIAGVPWMQEEAQRRVEEHLDGVARLDPDVAAAAVRVAARNGDSRLYDRYVARMQAAATSDAQEEGRFRDGLTAFEDPALVARTAEGCFTGLIRTQDLGLMLVSLLGSRHGRSATWPIVRGRWDTEIAPLEALLKARIVNGIAQLTPRDLAAEADAFLRAKQTPDTSEVTAQALERLRLDSASAARLSGQLPAALSQITQSETPGR
jgi:puromycin-sensitive aminopeptidase